MHWLLYSALVLFCFASLKKRITNRALYRRRAAGVAGGEYIWSPLADSIKELAGVAGGLYISFVAVFAFLKLRVPSEVVWWSVSFDPVALFCLLISLLLPYFNKNA